VIAMYVTTQRTHLFAQHASERHGQGLDHDDVEPALSCRRGDLCADEAGADDHDARATFELAPNGERICERAQRVDPLELGCVG